jgi:hypothetical protein
MKRNFCYAPFVHMYLHDEYDKKLCCLSDDYAIDSPDTEKPIPANLHDHWTSDFYKNVRRKMLNDEYVENCKHCYNQEAAGEFSERDRWAKAWEDTDIEVNIEHGNQYKTPIDFELRPGNLCNLQCRMCAPHSSSQLDKEYKNNKEILGPIYDAGGMANDIISGNIEYVLSNAGHIQQIKLLGGEPTIMPETIEILRILVERNILDINLHITTNCTNANATFLELIRKFKNPVYNFSIDGIGKTLEYIRYPLSFDKISANIQEMCTGIENPQAEFLYTLQAYSLPNLVDFLKWVAKLHITIQNNTDMVAGVGLITSDLKGPEWASIQSLPIDKRNEWLDNALNDNILNCFSSNHDEVCDSNARLRAHGARFELISSNIKEVLVRLRNDPTLYNMEPLIETTKRFDVVRNQHIKDFIPEIWDVFDQVYYNNFKVYR